MKELRIETVVRTTQIIQVPDEAADDYVARFKDKDQQRDWAKAWKKKLNLDDTSIGSVKVFVADIPEKAKKTRKKKA